MRRWLATLTLMALVLAPLHADVKVVQTLTMEGALAATVGGGAMPTVTMRIKGMKARFDMEMQGNTTTSIADLTTKQVILLDSANKTATYFKGNAEKAGEVAATLSKVDFDFKPTNQKKKIDGMDCEEYTFALTINMADMMPPGQQMSPEAAAALKDLRIIGKGSLWVARKGPGVAEFAAFQDAALKADVLGAMMGGTAATANGFDKFLKAAASAPGLPYVNEITMTVEGSSPVVGMLQAMGPMKLIQKTTSVTTEALSDDLFKVPEGYTIEKQ